VVTVSGRLVLGKDDERLEAATGELLQQGQKKFVFDISALDYADSSGIGSLVACPDSHQEGGRRPADGRRQRSYDAPSG